MVKKIVMHNEKKKVPSVSVVIIGLNEENHLSSCLKSVLASSLPPDEIICVDSGSSDKSVEVAQHFPIQIVQVSTLQPTPGLCRNEGLSRCKSEFVQFVDGDMCLEKIWLREALPVISSDPKIGSVFGRVQELGQSVYDKIIGADWTFYSSGQALAPGSGGLFRTSVLKEIGGYSPILVAGEETELGSRLRKAGYKILCLNNQMASHELELKSFFQYWKRCIRGGRAIAELLKMRASSHSLYSIFKPMLFTISFAIILISSIIFKIYSFIVIISILAVILIFRQALIWYKKIRNPWLSILVGIEGYFRMIPSTIGFVLGLISGRRSFD